jgi:hypothetical protein
MGDGGAEFALDSLPVDVGDVRVTDYGDSSKFIYLEVRYIICKSLIK